MNFLNRLKLFIFGDCSSIPPYTPGLIWKRNGLFPLSMEEYEYSKYHILPSGWVIVDEPTWLKPGETPWWKIS